MRSGGLAAWRVSAAADSRSRGEPEKESKGRTEEARTGGGATEGRSGGGEAAACSVARLLCLRPPRLERSGEESYMPLMIISLFFTD